MIRCGGGRFSILRRATPCSTALAVALALSAAPLTAIAQHPPAVKSSAPAGAARTAPRIMVFGDSLSAAYGIDPQQGWVTLLADRLKTARPAAQVINASISGETTRGGLSRIAGDVARHAPTKVLIELGANDGLRGLPVRESRANLEGIIKTVRAAHAEPVLIGIQIPPNYGLDYAREFRDMYGALAAQYKLKLVPFLLAGVADSRDNFQSDGLHPVAAAQPRILDNVWPVVEGAIGK